MTLSVLTYSLSGVSKITHSKLFITKSQLAGIYYVKLIKDNLVTTKKRSIDYLIL